MSDAFNELPAPEHLLHLRDDPVLAAAVIGDAAGEAALAALRDAIADVGRDPSAVSVIAVERTRLLRGIRPGQGLPPACESVYRADAVDTQMGEPATGRTWAVLHASYGRAGFAPNRDVAPDFIGNQLGFLAFLAACEMRAWDQDEQGRAIELAREQLAFLEDHIVRWIGPLTDRVRGAATGGFWPAVLALTQAHLQQERDYLRELLHSGADEREASESRTSS